MNKALFLDRDGVINTERGTYTYKIADFTLVDGIIPALHFAKLKGFQIIVITNQSGIQQNLYTVQDFKRISDFMLQLLGPNLIDAIFFCPHHPSVSKCLCRKPDSLLLEKAIAKYKIDVNQSFFIGDKERDKQAGEKIGLKSIQIEANSHLLPILEKIC